MTGNSLGGPAGPRLLYGDGLSEPQDVAPFAVDRWASDGLPSTCFASQPFRLLYQQEQAIA